MFYHIFIYLLILIRFVCIEILLSQLISLKVIKKITRLYKKIFFTAISFISRYTLRRNLQRYPKGEERRKKYIYLESPISFLRRSSLQEHKLEKEKDRHLLPRQKRKVRLTLSSSLLISHTPRQNVSYYNLPSRLSYLKCKYHLLGPCLFRRRRR